MSYQERGTGITEKYQNFNKLTRNGAIVVGVGLVAIGATNLALVAFSAAAFDQGQIMLIDAARKKKEV